MDKIKSFFKFASEQGLRLPFVYDAVSGKPSVTLLFTYITFILAMTSVIAFHFVDSLLSPAITSISFFALCTVFYLLRRLTKFKVDLDDRSIDLEGEDTTEEETKNE